MGKKRMPSPTEEDMTRIAETIDSLDLKNEISDRSSFDQSYNDYLEDAPELLANTNVRNSVFETLQNKHPSRISPYDLFKSAGGKDLKQDRKTTAKTIVKTKKEYIRRGAKNVDLEGYDTAKQGKKREMNVIGRVKGRIVYTEKVIVLVKGKKMVRHRDKLGRFASIKTE